MTGSAPRIKGVLPSTRLAIQAAASALAAIVVVNVVTLDRPYWVILTAVIVMVGTVGETLAKSIDRIVGTLFGLVVGLVIYWLAMLVAFPAAALLVVTAPSVVFLKFASYRLMVTAITASVVLLLEVSGATETLILARLLDTGLGAAIAVATSLFVLRIPTRRPVLETIDAYKTALAIMVRDALEAVIEGEWSLEIETNANQLRNTDADFEQLAAALRAETALIGGGSAARNALAVLPVLRGHVDAIIEAAELAARGSIGREVADPLRGIIRQIASNLDAAADSILSGTARELPKIDPYYRSIRAKLLPKLRDRSRRRDVVALLNLLLAVRRLNRGLRHAVADIGR